MRILRPTAWHGQSVVVKRPVYLSKHNTTIYWGYYRHQTSNGSCGQLPTMGHSSALENPNVNETAWCPEGIAERITILCCWRLPWCLGKWATKKQQLGKPLIFSAKRPNPGISWGSHTISGFPAGCGESCHSTSSWPIFFQVWDTTMAVSAWHQRESRCDALPTQRSPVIRAVEQRTCHWNSDESIDIQVVWSWNHRCCFGSPYKLDLVDIRRLYCSHRRHSWALSCHCYMDHPNARRSAGLGKVKQAAQPAAIKSSAPPRPTSAAVAQPKKCWDWMIESPCWSQLLWPIQLDLEVELGIWTLALETCINARKTIHLTGFQPCFPTTYQWRHPTVPAFVVSVHMHLKVGPCCDAQLLVTGWGDNDLMTWNWFPVPQNDPRVLCKRPIITIHNNEHQTSSNC